MLYTASKYLKIFITYWLISLGFVSLAQSPSAENFNSFINWKLFAVTFIVLILFIFLLQILLKKQKQKIEKKITEAIEIVKKAESPPNIEESEIMDSTPASIDSRVLVEKDEWMILLQKNANDLIENKKFSIAELASTMNLGERQFRRKLKQKANILPAAFMREARLQRAKQLLENGDFPTVCLLYTSPSPRDATLSRMPSSA